MAEDILTKRCSICGAIKPTTEFYQKRYRPDYIIPAAHCKLCHRTVCLESNKTQKGRARSRAAQRRYRARHRQRYLEAKRIRRKNPDVKIKEAIYNAQWRKDHAEQFRARRLRNITNSRLSKVKSEAKRRQSRAGIESDVAVTEALGLYRIGEQYWDVYSAELIDHPTIDHIMPICAGGDGSVDNLCVTSRLNNSSKNRLPLIIWMAQQARRIKGY